MGSSAFSERRVYKPITKVGKLLETLQPKWRDLLSHTPVDAEGPIVFPVSNKTLITKLMAWLSQMDRWKPVDGVWEH